jgi:hypothetical protein
LVTPETGNNYEEILKQQIFQPYFMLIISGKRRKDQGKGEKYMLIAGLANAKMIF